MRKRQVVLKRVVEDSRSSGNSANRNVRYLECQKNQAANIGGYALDGCREFMASGDQATNLALVCAACGCNRSFHRQEVHAAADVATNATN
ncbi:hypothetical protein SOVF_064840 [Spinacia oleracea]|nr:hypothetical protein SOVF_064840 [Spinacia oleracea]